MINLPNSFQALFSTQPESNQVDTIQMSAEPSAPDINQSHFRLQQVEFFHVEASDQQFSRQISVDSPLPMVEPSNTDTGYCLQTLALGSSMAIGGAVSVAVVSLATILDESAFSQWTTPQILMTFFGAGALGAALTIPASLLVSRFAAGSRQAGAQPNENPPQPPVSELSSASAASPEAVSQQEAVIEISSEQTPDITSTKSPTPPRFLLVQQPGLDSAQTQESFVNGLVIGVRQDSSTLSESV